ncbi:VOC family protein [Enterobacterales bacterium AW_CKDN230030176-1A_HGKHYDSX7]
MFHLSLPVDRFQACLAFYGRCFGADIVMLSDRAANLFVFGAQVTFHDAPGTALSAAGREAMHFGQVVSPEQWWQIRDRLRAEGHSLLKDVEPGTTTSGRGKLVVKDPGGNQVEINSHAPVKALHEDEKES